MNNTDPVRSIPVDTEGSHPGRGAGQDAGLDQQRKAVTVPTVLRLSVFETMAPLPSARTDPGDRMFTPVVLWLKSIYRSMRRRLRLSPIQQVMKIIEQQGSRLKYLTVLEAFAGDGQMQVVDYHRQVAHVSLWEWGTAKIAKLKKQFPGARVLQIDTFEQIKVETESYDIVVLDASPKSGDHWEVFDLFPWALNLLRQQTGVIVCTIMAERNPALLKQYPECGTEAHRAARAQFYGIPLASSDALSEGSIRRAFEAMAGEKGLAIGWAHLIPRNAYAAYFVFSIHPAV